MAQISDVACTVCGCVCDDLTIDVSGNFLTPLSGACTLARPWFDRLNRAFTEVARIAQQPVAYPQAIDAAVAVLGESRAPLIYGLSRSSTPGQQAAVKLADQLGAIVDTTASVCHGPSIMAIQQVGESTCSLGEIKQRADLVIFWGANPVISHPRHLERYSLEPISEFLPEGRNSRRLVVIDIERTATAELADLFIQVEPGEDFELIWQLRRMLRGSSADTFPPPLAQLHELLLNCSYGVVFFGLGLAQAHLGHVTVAGLLKLVSELNQFTRFVARRMRLPGDVSGADSVLCWQTGYPFAVDFARGYPRYNPQEFTAEKLLERHEVDACLLVGAESIGEFSAPAQDYLSTIPTIVLDPPHAPVRLHHAIDIMTATYGIHAAGTAYRMDEMPIPLRPIIPSNLPTDAAVLDEFSRRLQ